MTVRTKPVHILALAVCAAWFTACQQGAVPAGEGTAKTDAKTETKADTKTDAAATTDAKTEEVAQPETKTQDVAKTETKTQQPVTPKVETPHVSRSQPEDRAPQTVTLPA